MQVNGVGASYLGTGFHIGPKVQLKTPFFEIGGNLFLNTFLLFNILICDLLHKSILRFNKIS